MMIKIKKIIKIEKKFILCSKPHHIFREGKLFYCVQSLIIYLGKIL